jgi:hypothetical protein
LFIGVLPPYFITLRDGMQEDRKKINSAGVARTLPPAAGKDGPVSEL